MKRQLLQHLIAWKAKAQHLPLLLRGARQVGKTFLIAQFGRENFENVCEINFEFAAEFKACFDDLDPVKIIGKIELLSNIKITPGKTLLFLDEIQECPRAILALRYFKEKLPAMHVIGAGSLLEFVLEEENFSFPVGRVQFIYLKPLSYYEYLIAIGRENLALALNACSLENPLEPVMHELALKLLRQYLFIGGMPAAINTFLQTDSYIEAKNIQKALMQTYQRDFGKYAKQAQHKYLQQVFMHSHTVIGEQCKYANIDPTAKSRDLKKAIEKLHCAGLLHEVCAVSPPSIPLVSQAIIDVFKLLYLDIGLVQSLMKLDYATVLEQGIMQINAGALAEQLVGQELLAYADCYDDAKLFFWKRDKKSSNAEVDYIMEIGGHVIPIEVKAGKTGRLKSLQQFMTEYNSPLGIKISQDSLGLERGVLSVPLYLINQIERLALQAMSA